MPHFVWSRHQIKCVCWLVIIATNNNGGPLSVGDYCKPLVKSWRRDVKLWCVHFCFLTLYILLHLVVRPFFSPSLCHFCSFQQNWKLSNPEFIQQTSWEIFSHWGWNYTVTTEVQGIFPSDFCDVLSNADMWQSQRSGLPCRVIYK